MDSVDLNVLRSVLQWRRAGFELNQKKPLQEEV